MYFTYNSRGCWHKGRATIWSLYFWRWLKRVNPLLLQFFRSDSTQLLREDKTTSLSNNVRLNAWTSRQQHRYMYFKHRQYANRTICSTLSILLSNLERPSSFVALWMFIFCISWIRRRTHNDWFSYVTTVHTCSARVIMPEISEKGLRNVLSGGTGLMKIAYC